MPEIKKYIPEGTSWLRALVAAIPMAGGSLDHLLFDKADAIRMRNMEAAVSSLSAQLTKLGDNSIDKDWFTSEEALAAFKILSDKVSYEPDQEKINAFGRLVATCGTTEHSGDAKKLSVLEHLGRLSYVQIKLLSVMLATPAQQKKFPMGGLEQTATAIWLSDVAANLKNTPVFWEGTLNLAEEFEVLESLNTVRRMQLFGASELGFTFTVLGRLAATYVKSAKLQN